MRWMKNMFQAFLFLLSLPVHFFFLLPAVFQIVSCGVFVCVCVSVYVCWTVHRKRSIFVCLFFFSPVSLSFSSVRHARACMYCTVYAWNLYEIVHFSVCCCFCCSFGISFDSLWNIATCMEHWNNRFRYTITTTTNNTHESNERTNERAIDPARDRTSHRTKERRRKNLDCSVERKVCGIR